MIWPVCTWCRESVCGGDLIIVLREDWIHARCVNKLRDHMRYEAKQVSR